MGSFTCWIFNFFFLKLGLIIFLLHISKLLPKFDKDQRKISVREGIRCHHSKVAKLNTIKLDISNFDFSTYSLIENQVGIHWV